MKKKINSKILLTVLSVALFAAIALGFASCTGKDSGTTQPQDTAPVESNVAESLTQLGEGEKTFVFEAVDKDGSKTTFSIKTDAETVGEALLENKLISGTESEYGLMVDTVNGIKYDYNADKMYWAFYINGEYAQTGVDSTPASDSGTYSFIATAA